MKHFYYFATIIIFCCLSAHGREVADSVMTQELNEVVIRGDLRTVKGDTLSVVPSENQRKFSMTGYELIRSMMFPGLRVNTVSGELSLAGGESVVVQIDGRPVERQDILTLGSKNVAKIEYIQTPGAEYGYDSSIGAVINIVMKQRDDGYLAAVILNNAVTTANGQNIAFGKYNKGNSQFVVGISSEYTSLAKRRIDDNNIYQFESGPKNAIYEGINTPLKFTNNVIEAEYNHFVPEKHIFDLTYQGVFYYSPDRGYAQKVTVNGSDPYYQMTNPYEKYHAQRLNLYYKHFWGSSASLTANLMGSYRNTDYHHHIYESTTDRFDYDNPTYKYGTVSDRQAYIGEIKYMNTFNPKFTLSVGARGAYTYTSNDYGSNKSTVDRLHDTNIYAYTAASGYLGQLFYYAGVGLSGRIADQNHESVNGWMFRPELRFAYQLSGWRFNLTGIMLQNSPSLSEMATTEFRLNEYELKKGNPDLTDWQRYRMSLKIGKQLGPVYLQNTLGYTTARNPIMTCVDRVTNGSTTLFVTSFDNQKRMSVLTNNLALNYQVIATLSLSAEVNYNQYWSRGNTYSHDLDYWQFVVGADWYSGSWNIGLSWRSGEKSLTGETYSYSGATNNFYVNYMLGTQWRFGITGQYLFSKNGPTFEDEVRSQYMHKHETVYVPAQKNMIMISVAWNFAVGKQRQDADVDMQNSDNNVGVFK